MEAKVKVKLSKVQENPKRIITVGEQQIHQNGFPCISENNATYIGNGDTTIDVDTITFDVELDNNLFAPASFSDGDSIRLILQDGNSAYTKVVLKFLDIASLEVPLYNISGTILLPASSIKENIFYILEYVAVDAPGISYFKPTFVEGFNLSELLETNYVQLYRSIDSVTNYAESFTGKSIIDTDYKYELSAFPVEDDRYSLINTDILKFNYSVFSHYESTPYWIDYIITGNDYLPITLPKRDIFSVSRITYIDESDVEQDMDMTLFDIVNAGLYGEYMLVLPNKDSGFILPTDVKDTAYPYAIYFSAGYEDNNVPSDLKRAIQTHCAFLWANRGDMVSVAKNNDYKTMDKSDITKDIYNKYKYLSI